MKFLVWPFPLIAGHSLAGDRTYSNRHLGTIGSIPRILMHSHIYNSDNPGTNTDISPGLIPRRTVWKFPMPPTGRSLIGWGSYIIEPAPPGDDRVPSPVQGSFHTHLKTRQTGEENRVLSGRHRPPRCGNPVHWLESLIASSSTAAPRPSRRMVEAHQPMGGSSVAYGGDKASSPVQKSSESLQPQQRGNYNDDLPGRSTSPHGVSTPTPLISLFLVIGW